VRDYSESGGGVSQSQSTDDGDDETLGAVAAGVMILTDTGPKAVETLCAGTLVLTRDAGYRPILRREVVADSPTWAVSVPRALLSRGEEGYFSAAPSQLLLVAADLAARFGTCGECLVRASELVGLPDVSLGRPHYREAFHLEFEASQLFRADGVWCGSLSRARPAHSGMIPGAALAGIAAYRVLTRADARGQAA